MPLRERNRLLLAAGYAPVYPDAALDQPRMARRCGRLSAKSSSGHEPYPAVVVDRAWNLVEGNASRRAC